MGNANYFGGMTWNSVTMLLIAKQLIWFLYQKYDENFTLKRLILFLHVKTSSVDITDHVTVSMEHPNVQTPTHAHWG